MSKSPPLAFAVQVRVFPDTFGNHESEPHEEIVFDTKNRSDAYQFFEELKIKNSKTQKSIHYWFPKTKPTFQARILKYTPKEVEVCGWTWILKRYIDISYRCRITIDGKTGWTKKIYHVPPVLIDWLACPSKISSREAKAFACGILRKFLPADSFRLEKITAIEPIEFIKE